MQYIFNRQTELQPTQPAQIYTYCKHQGERKYTLLLVLMASGMEAGHVVPRITPTQNQICIV